MQFSRENVPLLQCNFHPFLVPRDKKVAQKKETYTCLPSGKSTSNPLRHCEHITLQALKSEKVKCRKAALVCIRAQFFTQHFFPKIVVLKCMKGEEKDPKNFGFII